MQLRIYNGEHFERGLLRRIVAGAVFVGLLVLTLYGTRFLGGSESWIPGWTDVLSTFLFIALCAAYRWYVRKDIERNVIAEITEEALVIDDKIYQWHAVQGFSMENKREDNSLYSIIFIINHHQRVHTLADTTENTVAFAHLLQNYTTFIEEVSFTWFDALLRRLKV